MDSDKFAAQVIKHLSDAHIEISQYIVETDLEDEEIAERTGYPIDWVESVRSEHE
jgi:transcription initiation factor IIE alpha subunit